MDAPLRIHKGQAELPAGEPVRGPCRVGIGSERLHLRLAVGVERLRVKYGSVFEQQAEWMIDAKASPLPFVFDRDGAELAVRDRPRSFDRRVPECVSIAFDARNCFARLLSTGENSEPDGELQSRVG